MTRKYKIEVDCANCALKIEEAVKKIAGVNDASVSFVMQRMKISFADDADIESITTTVVKTAKKIEPGFALL
ncbi:MAG: cation transporter [Muribaculum sp.]|nr:cation transporter [Muribaculaceae bacterium]MCM1080574.1 cation transporter [Muribaculum sp.]